MLIFSSTNGRYRLGRKRKNEIANNLVDMLEDGGKPTTDTMLFLNEWLSIGGRRLKVFIDVWNIVLDSINCAYNNPYPVLYRARSKRSRTVEGRISSYTGSFDNALNFNRDVIVVLNIEDAARHWHSSDAKRTLDNREGFYFSYYPLAKVMKKHNIYTEFLPEDEYIVRETSAGTKVFRLYVSRKRNYI